MPCYSNSFFAEVTFGSQSDMGSCAAAGLKMTVKNKPFVQGGRDGLCDKETSY